MAGSLLSMLAAAMLSSQTPPPAPPAPPKTGGAVISMTGCISRDTATPGSFLFSDTSNGATYRVSDGRKDAGQRGELVVGKGSRRVTVQGGLMPSPNVAAQASALGPEKAVIARTPGGLNAMANAAVPEFRVERVQPVVGPCP
jgi:hypothetical protein